MALAVLALATLALAFHRALGWLWQTWMERPEYSHGPMLPVVAVYLLWQRRETLRQLPFVGAWSGVLALAVAGALGAAGRMGGVYSLEQYAVVLAIAALTLSLVGWRLLREFAAPLLLLLLSIPPPNFILNNLSAQLQLLSSNLGVQFLRVLGVSVFLEGNVIDLGGYRLQVVEACDGMRYLFPLMTIGLLIAYLYRGAAWKRFVVFALSVPITVVMNSLRVGMIGLMVEHWGSGMAEGFLHEFQGWMVFMLSIGLLLAATALLNRVGRSRLRWRDAFLGASAAHPVLAGTVERHVPASFGAACLVALCLAGAAVATPARAEFVPERATFAAFPLRLGDFVGRRSSLAPEYLETLQLDDYLLVDYAARSAGEPVNLYASYYNSQRDRRVVHSPRACIPGGGWHIDRFSRLLVAGVGHEVNRMIVTNGDARQLVYYWFDQRGRHLTSEFAVKWYLLVDSVAEHRSDGAMIRLTTPLARGEPEAAADARLQSFAASAGPALTRYLPD
ncbi:MAG: VPLPA-CTERM-specific exosortase XrtD [Proteobacteria bacterium]|nr:VPLPA-CTERM-specific exosortase XrtD [Pseudomonadota bacterium]